MSKTSVFKVLRDQERWVCALKDKMQCTVVEDKHRTLRYKEMAIYIPRAGETDSLGRPLVVRVMCSLNCPSVIDNYTNGQNVWHNGF